MARFSAQFRDRSSDRLRRRGRGCGGRDHLRTLRHQDAEADGAARRRVLRRQHRAARLLGRGRQGQLVGLRRRFLPRHRGGDLRRSEEGQFRPARRQGALRGTRQAQGRRAGAQLDLDDGAGDRLLPALRRRVVLRRPGLHGAARAQRRFRAGARRQQGLRPVRHHHRAQPRRLFPRQQHEVRGEEVRHRRRRVQGL